jgi:hypothetical protein
MLTHRIHVTLSCSLAVLRSCGLAVLWSCGLFVFRREPHAVLPPVPCALCPVQEPTPTPPRRGFIRCNLRFVLQFVLLSCKSCTISTTCMTCTTCKTCTTLFSHSSSSHLVSFPPFSYLCAIFSKRFWNINLLIR